MLSKDVLEASHIERAKESDKAGVRSADRDRLLIKAPLRLLALNAQIDARIRNLSSGGLMAEAPIHVANGDPVEVELRNIGWISGKVAWWVEGRFGVAFDHPIDPMATRNPVSSGKEELPQYLQNLNKRNGPRIRSV